MAIGVGVIYAEKRWRVSRESAFFEFFLREVSTTPPPARPIYPRGGDPGPITPGRTAQRRQQRRPRKERHTRPDAGHAAPVCTRYQTSHAGQIVTARALEGAECVRNCADTDTRAKRQNRIYFYHFFVYVCCLCNFTNTLKSVIIMSAKAYTKKCKQHITKHQNRRTKP